MASSNYTHTKSSTKRRKKIHTHRRFIQQQQQQQYTCQHTSLTTIPSTTIATTALNATFTSCLSLNYSSSTTVSTPSSLYYPFSSDNSYSCREFTKTSATCTSMDTTMNRRHLSTALLSWTTAYRILTISLLIGILSPSPVMCVDPKFDPSTRMRLVLVPADAQVGSVIYRLRATDEEFDYPLTFEFVGDASSSTVKIESLPCTKYNSVCQANVVLSRRLESGRYYDFQVSVKDSKGGMATQLCSITATNFTTPHDLIFPHKPGIIMIPEDAKRGTELDYVIARKNPLFQKPVYLELWGSPLFAIRQKIVSPETTEGTIFLLGPLDFEKQAMYPLSILANILFCLAMALFNRKQFEVPKKGCYDNSNDIINKLDQILKNQSELAQAITNVNNRLDEIEKKIDINNGAHCEELAILKEMVKKNVPVPQTENFPIKSDEEMTAIEQKIQMDFQKYVTIIKIIITPGGINENFAKIVDKPIILSYNYDGTQNKKAFKEFKLLNVAIFEATKTEGSNEKEYRQKIRNCFKVHKARHFRKLSYNRKFEKS